MKIAQVGDVELISIKTKSLQDLDNELNLNLNLNKSHCDEAANGNEKLHTSTNSFSGKTHNELHHRYEGEEEAKAEREESEGEHYDSYVRHVMINKTPNGACGFHLTRTKWDPYPWVSAVDNFTPAAASDVKAGDCVLEVNGCDVLGLRITEIAKLVKSSHQVTLLLWSSKCNKKCNEESLCAAPMPRSLQRLSLVVQTILSLIECPVCLDTITPPAMQCQNGHLLCVNCRIRAEKCPVCRDRYFPRPALIAEQIQSAITSAFNLCRNEDKVRQKIFGRHNRQRQMVKTTLYSLLQKQQQKHQDQPSHKSLEPDTQAKDVGAKAANEFSASTAANTRTSRPTTITINGNCDRKVTDKIFKCARCSGNDNKRPCNKFFTKLLSSKAYPMENLTNDHNNTATTTTNNKIFSTCHTTITSAISQHELLDMQQQHHQKQQPCSQKQVVEHKELFKNFAAGLQQQTLSVTSINQFNDSHSNVARNHHCSLTYKPNLNAIEIDLNINSKLCCKQMLNNKMTHTSLLSDKDLTRTKESITCLLESNDKNKIAGSPILCETSYATIPRAIKIKEKHCPTETLCRDHEHAGKETTISSLKSHSPSMTYSNLRLTTPANCSTALTFSKTCLHCQLEHYPPCHHNYSLHQQQDTKELLTLHFNKFNHNHYDVHK